MQQSEKAISKRVFISYRRKDNWKAWAIFFALKNAGYDVFMDVESLDGGQFPQKLLDAITARAHFILILTPDALQRCQEAEDWLRREIEHAIRTGRNIVPLSFDYLPETALDDIKKLDGDIVELKNYTILPIPSHDFPLTNSVDAIVRMLQVFVEETPLSENDRNIERRTVLLKILAKDKEDEQKEPSAEEYFEQGNQLYEQGNKTGAIQQYNRAIELNPHLAQAYYNRGLVYSQQEAFRAAIEDFTQAIKIDSSYAEAYYSRGVTYFRIAHIARRQRGYRRNEEEILIDRGQHDLKIAGEKGILQAHVVQGIQNAQQKNLQSAINNFTTAIRRDPKYADAYFERGRVYFDLGKYEKAIQDFTITLDLDPEKVTAYYYRGSAYKRQNKIQKMCEDYRAYLRLRKSNQTNPKITRIVRTRMKECKQRNFRRRTR